MCRAKFKIVYVLGGLRSIMCVCVSCCCLLRIVFLFLYAHSDHSRVDYWWSIHLYSWIKSRWDRNMVNRCDVVTNCAATASISTKEKILRPVEVLRIFIHNQVSRYFIFYRPMKLYGSVRYMNKIHTQTHGSRRIGVCLIVVILSI